jgi:stearoyl-CoA desaturase (delta-9 desaturase)
VHAGCALVLLVGASPIALAVCGVLFLVRAFGLTAGYHRLLAHRAFATSRPVQLAFAALGASAAQLGPLWWAGHHRLHHRFADTERDPHPPAVRGLWWAHMGWLLRRRHARTPVELVPDLARYPELRWLDRHPLAPPALLMAALAGAGFACERLAPELGTGPLQLVAWGFFVSTTLLYHATFAVNSLGHRRGSPALAAPDRSRNSFWLALATLGDGWHGNHHADPAAARHGRGRWQLDPTYAGLRLLAALGLVWELRAPRASARATAPAQADAKASPTRA